MPKNCDAISLCFLCSCRREGGGRRAEDKDGPSLIEFLCTASKVRNVKKRKPSNVRLGAYELPFCLFSLDYCFGFSF